MFNLEPRSSDTGEEYTVHHSEELGRTSSVKF